MCAKLPKYFGMVLSLLVALFLASGCSNQQDTPAPKSSVPAADKFYLGLIPEHDLLKQKMRYNSLADYISEKAGIDVELSILSRYGNIIENFNSGRLDGAFFGSFTGALAIKKLGVVPLARPIWLDGTSSYYGMIFTRKDSGIRNAKDMKGKRFAFVDKATTAGWLLPLHYFHEAGIDDYRTWFAETYFTGTHEDAIYDVLYGKADIGAAKNTVYDRLWLDDKTIAGKLQILATSPEVPSNTLAVRKTLDENLKAKLKNVLLQMDQDEKGKEILHKFGALKFTETGTADYAPVFTYAGKIQLDLKMYDYIND